MALARRIEQRLEQLVDGMSAAIFRGGMHPVEVAGRLVRQADLLVQETWMGPAAPNVYSVRLNPKDVAEGLEMPALERELGTALAASATERGWRIGGPINVSVIVDPSVAAGSIGCEASVAPGPMQPWGHLIGTSKTGVHELGDNRVLIGRRTEADITLPVAEVSRSHAIIYRHGGRIWILDLGSANGTWVNGSRVGSEPEPVSPGDQLTIGPASFLLQLV